MKKNYTKEDALIYLDDLYKETNDDSLVDQEKRTKILELIENGCKITNLSVANLLSRLDFKPKDLTIEALEAFLAELRSIFWLRDNGFTKIVPHKAGKFVKSDFTANYKNKECVIEVFCLTQAHEQQKDLLLEIYKNFDPQYTGSKFGRDFISKANNKRKQLDSSNVKIKILLCVINYRCVNALNSDKEMQNHAKYLCNQLNWGDGYYVGLINKNGSGVIYPKIY